MFKYYLDEDLVATGASNQEIVIPPECSWISIYALYDATWTISDGVVSFAINAISNNPRVNVLAPLRLQNVDGQIKKIYITTPADCTVNVKQEGGLKGIDRRVGR